MKGLLPHVAALGLATALALVVWSRGDKAGDSDTTQKIEVWGGTPERVESIRFESPQRTVSLAAKKDATGTYYVGTVDKEEGSRPKPNPAASADAGAPPAPLPPSKRVTTHFVGVKEAVEFAGKLAPLFAVRELGPIAGNRAEEFGLDKPEGTLKVKVAGVEQVLVIGGTTPGGQERYAKREPGGVVYAVSGDVVQTLLGAESRLLERELHGFAENDVTRLRITRAGKSREAVTFTEKKGAWADAAQPGKLDETLGNFVSKVGRLHPTEYVEAPSPPLTPESAVLRIEYFGGTKSLGFLELYKAPGEKGNDYFVRTEYSRWTTKVLASTGEQVEQDVASIVR
ncbi:MAG TPA: DUF4340 domain-containing protein [Polyangiaceae bacterium]|jgi:hypothetical protein|nr:DUF4340 domain-containing protein [Polyangiaceae bacterium]